MMFQDRFPLFSVSGQQTSFSKLSRICAGLTLILTIGAMSFPVFARTASGHPHVVRNVEVLQDSAATYVSGVFERLRSYWEQQAYDQRLEAEVTLKLTLDERGIVAISPVGTMTESARQAMAFIRQCGSFGRFPRELAGSRLEMNIRVTEDSLHLVGYQIPENTKSDPLVSFTGPVVAQPVSLFYARALPVTAGIVREQPDMRQDNSVEMQQYIEQVREQIRQNWRLAEDYPFSRTVAILMIDRDGSLLGAQIQHSSGDKVVDKAALNAIYTAGAFPRVPAGVQSLPLTIEYVFDPVSATVEDAS